MFQSVVAPNGLIVNLYGPVEGKKHDSAMLTTSNLYNQLVQYSKKQMVRLYALMGILHINFALSYRVLLKIKNR